MRHKRLIALILTLVLTVSALPFTGVITANAASVWVVNTANDCAASEWSTSDNILSLREAISRAAGGDTITFTTDSSVVDWTEKKISLTAGELVINKKLTIDAGIHYNTLTDKPGVEITKPVNSSVSHRIIYIKGSVNVYICGLAITGGYLRQQAEESFTGRESETRERLI